MNNLEQLNKIRDIYGQPRIVEVGNDEMGKVQIEVHPLKEEDVFPLSELNMDKPEEAKKVINSIVAKLLNVSDEEAQAVPLNIKMELADYVNQTYAGSERASKAQKAIDRFKK